MLKGAIMAVMGNVRSSSTSGLGVRFALIGICVGCLTSLAADNPRSCAGVVGCRWPTAREQFQQAPPSIAETWINDLAAGDGFEVESVQHYPPEQTLSRDTVGVH